MKLLFVINDSVIREAGFTWTGELNTPIKRRVVEIELTSEQEKKLGIRELGRNCGKPEMETIESISEMLEPESNGGGR